MTMITMMTIKVKEITKPNKEKIQITIFKFVAEGSGKQGPGKYTFACSTPDEEVQGSIDYC